ncbi:MAG: T9SS type A sorting domain-containing protein [Bacteroidetes bacterium]|nr:T9SS type A sorting domain-containing protein [Bacteroidota bacterium]
MAKFFSITCKLLLGTTETIRWNANSLPGGSTLSLEYTIDNGTTWIPIAAGITGATTKFSSFNGLRYVQNYKDSVVCFFNEKNSNPSSYHYRLFNILARNDVLFNGSFSGNTYSIIDSMDFRNYFVKDSSLFILLNYQPISPKTQTIIVRRNLNKRLPGLDFYLYDSIINLPRANALFMFNDSAGIIIGDTYIAKSLNYTTWDISYNCPNCNFKQVWFTSKDTGYVIGSKNGKALILKSMDGGITWREQLCPVNAPLNDIKFTDDGKVGLIVGDSGTILRTENGGGTSFVGVNSSKIKSPNFNLYPNPANNQLIIVNYQLPIHSTYSIYTIQGKLLQEGLVQENETIMDIHKYHPGLYFITIGTTTLKFVKE